MKHQQTKILQVPLAEPLFAALTAAATDTGRPTSEIARDAIERWLDAHRRVARRAEIASYAGESAGTDVDVDRGLERAAVEHLRAGPKKRAARRA
jgi:hypothetical protein